MGAFSGPQGKGAAKRLREIKRQQAEARNALTPVENTAAYRRTIAAVEQILREA